MSFSWNLTTVEGREGVTDLLEQTLAGTDPSGFALEEPADEADGVVTAWFVFETRSGADGGCCAWSRRTASAGRSPS